MQICIPSEKGNHETRTPLTPQAAEKLIKAGFKVKIESGAGDSCFFRDDQYRAAGAEVTADHRDIFRTADILMRIHKSTKEEIGLLKPDTLHISFFDPFSEQKLVEYAAKQGIRLVSLEMLPRTTLAQKMDALSSQASLAGYAAVIIAARRLKKIFPMMMTPAGTITPAKVFVIGAGVAGLQAIATANRLGARVSAFDTRPVVEEQVQSLGARFVKLDLGETGQTQGGYAKVLTDEQLELQRKLITKHCAASDVVITTARLFGRKSPLIITHEMVQAMQPGSVIVDLAVASGGNVEGVLPGQEVNINGVAIIGMDNLPGEVAIDASAMYAGNLVNFILDFWDKEKKQLVLDPANDIIAGCLLTCNNEIVNPALKSIRERR